MPVLGVDANKHNLVLVTVPSQATPAQLTPSDRSAAGFARFLEPHTSEGGYVNFMAEDDQQTFDPDNLFHRNQNNAPAG